MFHSISEKIIAYAINNNGLELDADKQEEYVYGLEITIAVLLNYVSVLIIGLCMGMLWQAMFFLILYGLIRRFAGGLHFQSQLVCYIFTCIIGAVVLTVIKYTGSSITVSTTGIIVSSLVLIILSPVPAEEKPLDDREFIVYRNMTRLIIISIDIVYAILLFNHLEYMVKIIAVTVCTAAIFLILGKLKTTFRHDFDYV